MERVKKSFQQWFVGRRKALGWAQRDLMDASKVNLRTISRLESGERTPNKQSLRAFARAMGVPEDEMLLRARGVVPASSVAATPNISPSDVADSLKVLASADERFQMASLVPVRPEECNAILLAIATRLTRWGVAGGPLDQSAVSGGRMELASAPSNQAFRA